MRFFIVLLLALCVGGLPLCALAEEEEPVPESAESSTNAPVEELAAVSNAPAPALVGLVLSVGTGAMILSGVDWSSDDEPPAQSAGAPAPARPAEGEVVVGGTVVFSWKAASGASTYLVDVDQCEVSGSCADFRLEQTADTSLTVEWPIESHAGRWRVRAVDAERRAGPWSAFFSFSVNPSAE
ncbi:MAG: hypothetical protein J5I99_05300 [Verrucomicrobia bacterium]|nr:hypothetical protein [Verrucomicrobiota bacterium]